MGAAERIDLTRASSAVVRSANLSIGLFVLAFGIGSIFMPVSAVSLADRDPRLLDGIYWLQLPAIILAFLIYPIVYFLVCVRRVWGLTELVALGFGFVVSLPVGVALGGYYDYLYRAYRLSAQAYWERELPGFQGNWLIVLALEHAWISSLVVTLLVAAPFIVAAWRFRRLRSWLARHGLTLAYQPWRKPSFRAQMRGLSRWRVALALALFFVGILAIQAVPFAILGAFASETGERMAAALLAVVAAMALMHFGQELMIIARRHAMRSLGQVLKADQRPPMLFLRSFEDDHMQLASRRKPMLWPLALRRLGAEESFEEALTIALTDVGPVVAIGRPGEQGAPVGAAREYVSNEDWQQRVEGLIAQAALIVVVIGDTKGLAWEVERLLTPGVRDKVLFAVPPVTDGEAERRWSTMLRQVAEIGGHVSGLPTSMEKVLVFSAAGDGVRLYCAADRAQDRYELALAVAGHEATAGRIPLEEWRRRA